MWGVGRRLKSIVSYEEAESIYGATTPLKGRPNFRPLDRRSSRASTDIRKVGDDYIVRMYSTDIVRYLADGSIFLDRGVWPTLATAAALSASSPFACWTHYGEVIVRSASLKRFVLHSKGLLFVNGEPVDPPVAVQHKTRVNRDKAKKVRTFFKDVPRFIKTFSAMCAGQPLPKGVRAMCIDSAWGLDGVLDEMDAAALAWGYVKAVTVHVTNNPVASTADFWKAAYSAFDVIEAYDVELPFGEVAK